MLLTGLLLSCLAVASCEFVDYTHEDESGLTTSGSAGLYRFLNDEGNCVKYASDQSFDDKEEKARAGGVVAPLLGMVAFGLVTIEFFCCRICCGKLMIGLVLLVAQIMQGLSFLFFGSESFCDGDILEEIVNQKPCTVSSGSVFSIVALLLYFFVGVIILCTPKPTPVTQTKDVDTAASSTPTFPAEAPSKRSWTDPELV